MSDNSFLENVMRLIQMHSEGLLGGEIMPEGLSLGLFLRVNYRTC